jgi:transposase, IS6 family
VVVDHVTVYRWVQRFTPLFVEWARPCRHAVGDRWFVDETYLKISGRWCYLYRAIDQFGQVIDVYLSARRDATAARAFFSKALSVAQSEPVEVVTDRAHAYVRVIEGVVPAAWHHVECFVNNPVECDHGRLKARRGVSNANVVRGW